MYLPYEATLIHININGKINQHPFYQLNKQRTKNKEPRAAALSPPLGNGPDLAFGKFTGALDTFLPAQFKEFYYLF